MSKREHTRCDPVSIRQRILWRERDSLYVVYNQCTTRLKIIVRSIQALNTIVFEGTLFQNGSNCIANLHEGCAIKLSLTVQ